MFQKPLSILTVHSHYIYSCIIYVRDNQSESKYENYYIPPNKGTLRVERRRVELSIKKTNVRREQIFAYHSSTNKK